VIQKVMDREIDLGIITLHSHGTELEALPLFDHRLVAVVSPEHPLSSRKVLDLEELARERLILLERASITRQRIDGYFQMARCDSRPILELSNFEIIKRYVAAGLGVSLVPEVAVSPVRDGVCAIPLRPALSLPIGVIFRRDRKLSQPGKAFLTMAEEFYRAHQASSRAGPEGN
jgi:DNA-binding transcriptional LysR family regulator